MSYHRKMNTSDTTQTYRGAQCTVTGCKKRKRKITEESYIRSDSEGSQDEESPIKRLQPRTFHRLPVKTELKKIWIKNMGREDWSPSTTAHICSDHFKESCINRNGRHNIMLIQGSVPTRFKNVPNNPKRAGQMNYADKLQKLKDRMEKIETDIPGQPLNLTDLTISQAQQELSIAQKNINHAGPGSLIFINSPANKPMTDSGDNAKRKHLTDQIISLKESLPIAHSERKDNPQVGSGPIYFDTESQDKRINELGPEIKLEGTEDPDQAMVNNNEIKNEPENVEIEADQHFISEVEEIRVGVVETTTNHNSMKKEILMLKTKLAEAVRKINSNEKFMLETKLSEAELLINLYEKKMDSIIDSCKKKMDLKSKKIRILRQSNRRLVKNKERLINKISDLKKRTMAKKNHANSLASVKTKKNNKNDLKKNYVVLSCDSSGLKIYPDGAQHHSFEIVERRKNNKVQIVWRKNKTVISEDGNGSAESSK